MYQTTRRIRRGKSVTRKRRPSVTGVDTVELQDKLHYANKKSRDVSRTGYIGRKQTRKEKRRVRMAVYNYCKKNGLDFKKVWTG